MAVLALGWWYYSDSLRRNRLPDYLFSIRLVNGSGPGSESNPAEPDQPIPLVVGTHFPAGRKVWPNSFGHMWGGSELTHPFEFPVRDPDGLISIWRRPVSEAQFRQVRDRWWNTSPRSFSTEFDLSEQAPKWFDWPTGRYTVGCMTQRPARGNTAIGIYHVTRGTMRLEGSTLTFFVGKGAKAVPVNPQVLKATLESNKTQFVPGELITLRGFLENVGLRPFLVQTRLPFREARIVSDYGRDFFPNVAQSGQVRLDDFTRLEPGQRIMLFEESFVAGRPDPHWQIGVRRASFPQPFWGRKWTIHFTHGSQGLLPEDREPNLGIWSGRTESNRLELTCREAE